VPPLPAPVVLRDRVLERLQLTGVQAADAPGQGPGSSGPPGPPAGAFQPAAAGRPATTGPPEGPGGRGAAPSAVGQGAAAPPAGGPAATPPRAGGPGGRGATVRNRRLVATVAAAAVLAAAVGVALGWERAPTGPGPGGSGGPVVAGAATSVPAGGSLPPGAGSTASTGSSTSSPSSATTATSPTTVPAAAGTLAVSPAAVDLGAGETATLTLRNDGDQPFTWTAGPSAPWLRASPASGRLDGGERASVTLTAERAGLPEGTADGTVELAWDGSARRVEVSMDVEHPPEVGGLSASPGQVGVTGCPTDTARVQATVEDESPLASVVLEWGGRQVPMTGRSGAWFATLGPVDEPATVPWRVVAADVRGNSAAASGPPVSVVACIP
jgi:hypothetical protein